MKEYTIVATRRNGSSEHTGSLENLARVFGYTLECGNSWDISINRYPKTAKALVNALNKSARVCGRYYDGYSLK